MGDDLRSKVLKEITAEIVAATSKVSKKIQAQQELVVKLTDGLRTWYKGDDVEVIKHNISQARKDIVNLNSMLDSPYFFMGEVKFSDQAALTRFYISKYSFPENNIYSWISPIARIRFEKLGKARYLLPTDQHREGIISRKDTYVVRQGELYDATYETTDTPKTKIVSRQWQEQQHFGLNEIIERLDAYQDDIIRINPYGSMLIAGAAGSGKTTLALHRIAYLVQNPETSHTYRPSGILIFVQDESTKEYFSSILPGLGLQSVTITTYAEWALKQVGIDPKNYIHSPNDIDFLLLTYAKSKAIKNFRSKLLDSDDVYERLESHYYDYFDENTFETYKRQKAGGLIDRFDLTLLMTDKIRKMTPQESYQLILVDEAENYLAQELRVIQQYVSSTTLSMMYIGDLVQQTFPFTIKSWDEVGERFVAGRKIVIPKVYRITDQIRNYLVNKGYAQDTSQSLRRGLEVEEHLNLNLESVYKDINERINTFTGLTGILSNNEQLNEALRKNINADNTHFLTIQQAQGVEFDNVFLICHQNNQYDAEIPSELLEEIKKVERDLFLVGITRAKERLTVYLNQFDILT